jgi:hypothetical protein
MFTAPFPLKASITRIRRGGLRGAVKVAEQIALTPSGPWRSVIWHDVWLRRPRTIGA